jgi:hypothetical protein
MMWGHTNRRLLCGLIIQSYEPGEDCWYCYLDDTAFTVNGAPSFSHP